MTTYLHEDLHQIRRYFPGARAVSLHTPFDLSDKPAHPRASNPTDTFRDDEPSGHWFGDFVWNR
jgi:hypothetical protein